MMPRSGNEDLRFRVMWMAELLGYSILLAAVALHMSPKTSQHYVLIKNWFMLSVRISSYGCTQEVWRVREKRKSCSRR